MNRWKYTKDVDGSLPIVAMPDGEGTRLKRELQFIFASGSKTLTFMHGGVSSLKDETLSATLSNETSITFDDKMVDFTVFETPQGRRAVVLLQSGDVQLVTVPSAEIPCQAEVIGDMIKIKAVKKHLKSNKSLEALRVSYLPLGSHRANVPTVAVSYISAANTLTFTLFAVEGDNIAPRGSTKLPLLPSHATATAGYHVSVSFLSASAADAARDQTWGVAPLPGASLARGVSSAPEVIVHTTPLDKDHPLASLATETEEAAVAAPVETGKRKKGKDAEPAAPPAKKSKKKTAEDDVLDDAAKNAGVPVANVRLLSYSTETASLVEVRSHDAVLPALTPSASELPRRHFIAAAPCQFLEAALDPKTKSWIVLLRDAHIGASLFAAREWMPANNKGDAVSIEKFGWFATDAGAVLPAETVVRKTVRALVAVAAPTVSVLNVTVRTVELADVIAVPIASIAADAAPLPAPTGAPSISDFLAPSRPAGLVATLDAAGVSEDIWAQLRTALATGSYKPSSAQSAVSFADVVAKAIQGGLLPHLAVRRLAALAAQKNHPFSQMHGILEALVGSGQLTGGCVVNLLVAHEALLSAVVADCAINRCLLVDALRERLPTAVAVRFLSTLNEWLSLSTSASESVVRRLAPSIPSVAHIVEFAACVLDAKFTQFGIAGNDALVNALASLHQTLEAAVEDSKMASTAIATLVGTADAAQWLANASGSAVAGVGLGQKLIQVQKLVVDFM